MLDTESFLLGIATGGGGDGGNHNYVETIEGTAFNPFGEMTDSDLAELRAAINSNLATVLLYLDGSSIGMPAGTLTVGPRTDTDQEPYRFWFNAITNMGESINDFQAIAILYDKTQGTFGLLSGRVANGGNVIDLTAYASRIPTALTIIHHPLP